MRPISSWQAALGNLDQILWVCSAALKEQSVAFWVTLCTALGFYWASGSSRNERSHKTALS